jgi:hypothetical protein
MKKLLISTAVVLLVTQADARPWTAFKCGTQHIAELLPKYFKDSKTHYFDMRKDSDQKHSLPNSSFRVTSNGNLFFNGKLCHEFAEEDYEALHQGP